MPAMKRPAAAAAGIPPQKKQAASTATLAKKCESIREALRQAEGLSPSMQAMLTAGVESSLGVPKDKRHPVQEKVVGWITEALSSVKASIEEKRAAAAAAVANADGERKSREDSLEAAKQTQAERHDAVTAKKEASRAAGEALKAAKAAVLEAERAQAEGDAELKNVEAKKASLASALEAFEKLQAPPPAAEAEEGAPPPPAVDTEASLAVVSTVGKEFGFDPSMLTALPSAFSKAPDQRGQFDTLVLDQFREEHAKKMATLDAELEAARPAREERAAAVDAAKKAEEEAASADETARAELQAAQTAQADADAATKAAQKALKEFAGEMKTATLSLSEAEKQVKAFAKGPLADLDELTDFDGTLPHAGSQYRHIGGVRYERELLELAAGEDTISKDSAEKLFTAAMDGPGVTPTEKRTLRYIVKRKKVADDAKSYLETKMGSSWYQTVDGVKYERLLLTLAEDATAGGAKLTKEVAEKLWKSAMDANQVTPTEKRTLEHILATKEFEEDAKAFLEGHLAKAEVPEALAALED
eukprot:TRINITY_DN2030_c0_g1_i1.p2 TRINITY_DN2030_c0_g1~~TRINITY_DN2030_c0_g1_i1.p2  ORF type:complete len:556 (+),score=213.06 TRINITY_DN2030_c0_g1_i1:73-1668(+)